MLPTDSQLAEFSSCICRVEVSQDIFFFLAVGQGLFSAPRCCPHYQLLGFLHLQASTAGQIFLSHFKSLMSSSTTSQRQLSAFKGLCDYIRPVQIISPKFKFVILHNAITGLKCIPFITPQILLDVYTRGGRSGKPLQDSDLLQQ